MVYYAAGQKLTAALFNSGVGAGFDTYLGSASASSASNTTLMDSGLSFPVEANGIYAVTGVLFIDSDGTADIKFGWLPPAGATGQWTLTGPNVANGGTDPRIGNLDSGSVSLATVLSLSGDNHFAGVYATGRPGVRILNGGTAGTVKLQFAQNTSTAYATKVQANSFLSIRRIG